MEELKSCPFDCGHDPNIDIRVARKENTNHVYVECGYCGARGETFGCSPIEDAERLAIKAWNRRATS